MFLIAVPVMVLMLVAAPALVPEFKDPENAGRADLFSVLLSMATLLPIVYGIKELAKYGPQVLPILMIVAGFAVGVVFLRRQRILTRPLIDVELFRRRPFSVSLASQTLGLFAQGAIQFLIMQYLQLVVGMSPLEAGLWTVGPLLMGIVGSLMAPRVARLTSQVYGLAFGFGLAAGGFLLILPGGLGWTVVGFTLTSFGINLGMVLVYDMILASAPRERAGTASGMAETGNELGIALGIAVIGSLSAAVYRAQVTESNLPGIPSDAVDSAREGVGNAAAVASDLPADAADQMLRVSQDAFSSGLQTAAGVLALVTAGIAIAGVALLRGRHAPPSDDADGSDAPEQPDDAGDERGGAPEPVG